VILGAVGLAGFGVLVAAAAGPGAALAAGALLAVHPSYLDYTVLDNGGVSVWMFGMGILGLAVAYRLRRPTTASAFLLGAAAGLAAWSRANLLWLVAAGAVSALFVFGRRAWPSARDGLAAAAGALVGGLPLVVYELASRFGTLRYIGKNRVALTGAVLRVRLRALAGVLVSDGEQRSIWWGPRAAAWEIAIGAALLALTLACAFAGPRSPSRATAARRAFAAAAIALSAILLTSRLAVSQHHLVAVLPLVIGALSIAAFELGSRAPGLRRTIAVAFAAFLALSLSWDFRIDAGLRRTGGKYGWSSALQEAADFLAAHPVPPERLKIVPWGFQNNLYVLTGGAVRGTELHWGATRSLSSRGRPWRDEIRDGGSFLYFLFPSDPPPAAITGFSEALAEDRAPRRETIFRDRSGTPVIALREIPPH
jgi:hypothetical protein